MKSLSHYTEKAMTKVLDNNGAFFAFSDKQFDEGKKEGVKYTTSGMGMIVPVENLKTLEKAIKEVVSTGIQQDIADNGEKAIIKRELANHESYYTGEIEQTIEALSGYNFTTEAIMKVFRVEQKKEYNY